MRKTILVLIVCLLATTAFGQQPAVAPNTTALKQQLQLKLDEWHKAGKFPGATLGVVLANGESFSLAVGFSDRDTKTPMMATDRMLAGSVGKTFAAATALQLIQEGRINLDEKVEKYLGGEPWFSRLPNAKEITVRQLMNHTSGLVRYEFKDKFTRDLTANAEKRWQPAELVAYLLDEKAPFAAGKGWDYSDTNYIVLGMIIEKVTRRKFYDEANRRIIKPLKLTNTIPQDGLRLAGVVQGYAGPNNPFGGKDEMIHAGKFIINPQFEWTGGGYASTAGDLARWAKMIYEGKAYSADLLPQVLDGVPAPMLGRETRYGLGVIIRRTAAGVSYGHSGFFPGYMTDMMYFPEQKIAIAVQVNTSVSRDLGKPLSRVLSEVLQTMNAAESAPGRAQTVDRVQTQRPTINNMFPRWSHDGKKIVFTSDRDGDAEIYSMNADGSNPVRLTHAPGRDAHPFYSRDGRKILFQSPRSNGKDTNIYVMNSDGSNVVQLTNLKGFAGVPEYSPDEKRIIFQWRESNDFRDDKKWRICLMDSDGSNFRVITPGASNDQVPNWSRDGKRLLFYSDRTGKNQIYTMKPDGADARRLVATESNDNAAFWSPDDKQISFASDRDGNSEVYVMTVDGKNVRRLTNTRATERAAVWSPDGNRMVFSSDGDGPSQVFVMNADGSQVVSLTGSASAEDELIKMHQELLQFHLNGDVESWLATESEQYVVANRGEVTHPTKKDREARIGPYLKRTRFKEYRDVIAPVVRISRDGSLAWLIAQVKASGVQTTNDGKQEPIEFTSAWIELFEKRDGKWIRIGNVSNFKPVVDEKRN